MGIDEAVTVDKKQIKLIKKLITYNRKSKWFSKADEFLEVIESHPCCAFFKSPVPVDFQEFHLKNKETRDTSYVRDKLTKMEYRSLKDFIKDLALIWTNFKNYYKPSSFFYKLADTMEIFMTHLIKEEGVFDTYEPDEDRINSRTERLIIKEKIDLDKSEDEEEGEEEEESYYSKSDSNLKKDCHVDIMLDENS